MVLCEMSGQIRDDCQEIIIAVGILSSDSSLSAIIRLQLPWFTTKSKVMIFPFASTVICVLCYHYHCEHVSMLHACSTVDS